MKQHSSPISLFIVTPRSRVDNPPLRAEPGWSVALTPRTTLQFSSRLTQLERLREQLVRAQPAAIIAGDGDRHQFVGAERFSEFDEVLAHRCRRAGHHTPPVIR